MALPATAVGEVRTAGSDTQCAGFFDSVLGGVDFSQQDTAQATGTVTSATTAVTATTSIFTSNMVGNYITDGTTFKEITAFTSGTIVTVDSAPSWTAATIFVGGALASPGKAGSVMVSGNDLYIKAGTYTVTSASSNVVAGCLTLPAGASAANTVKCFGYQTTRGDGGTKPLLQASGISTFTLVTAGTNSHIENISVDGAGLTSSRGFNVSSASVVRAVRCKALNCTNSGFLGSSASEVLLCEAVGCSTQAAFATGSFIYCVSHANTVSGFSLGSGGSAIGCVSAGNTGASSDGFVVGGNGDTVIGCVAYGNGRHGFNGNTVTAANTLINCYAESNAGFGYTISAAMDNIYLYNCGGYNNTSGNVNTTNIPTGQQINFITGSVTAFTAAGSNDFSLNATVGGGAQLRAAGIPALSSGLYGLPGLSTNSFPDVGAAQHQDPASTTISVTTNTMLYSDRFNPIPYR